MTTDQIADQQSSPLHGQPAQSGFAEARVKVTELERHARAIIRERPIVAVLAAVGLGYLTARLVSRATR